MTERSTGHSSEKVSRWAQRFAERREHVQEEEPTAAVAAERAILEAVDGLWEIVDEAVAQVMEALDESGVADRIEIERTNHDYHLTMPGPRGEERHIDVFVNLRAVEGHLSGGGDISTNTTRAMIGLIPTMHRGHVHWTVAATGKPFTVDLVGDLFLSVFTDDPAAANRLTPSFTVSQ